jgi:rhodanese-related sulfurtransferase
MNLQTVKKITPQQAHDLIEKLKYDPDFVILDLRTPEEYKKEHIENAKNLNYYSKTFKNDLNKLEKDKTYVIHCRSGGRSGKTAPIMKELGFNEVYDMGGITQWKEQGFETVK